MAAILLGDTLGHTDDTDLITLADGIATVAGEISVTTLDIGGTNVTKTAAQINNLVSTSAANVFTEDQTLSSSDASQPVLNITNTHAGATSGELRFNKDSASGADNDVMGMISFYGTDDSDNTHERLAYMDAIITDSAHGSEASSLRFYVAENDATLTQGLLIAGQADDNGEVDVTIGAGAGSTTTIAGNLTVSGTTTTVNSTTLSVADDLITVSKGNDTVANADGSGMEIDATGGTNLYWKYVHANTAWQSNVDIDTSATGNVYKIAGTEVLGPATLGSGVLASSLTSLGTIASLVATTADINAGTVDNATIGASTHTTGKFTTCDATTDFTIDGLVLTADTITNDAALTVVSTGLTLNASLDIALSADGGNVTMDDGTTTVFDFNTDDPELKIMDDAQVANYCSIAVGANGATTMTTVDADAAAANLIITADGTVDIDSAGLLTLDSGAAINIEPAAGSAILLDGTISIDAGVVTGATSITSTDYAGSNISLTSASGYEPKVELKNTTNNNDSAWLSFVTDAGAAGADNDNVMSITWTGDDDAQAQTMFGALYGGVADASNGTECGNFTMKLASDGSLVTAISGMAATSDIVYLTFGQGNSDYHTVNGDMQMGHDGAAIYWGADLASPDVYLTHEADTGLILSTAHANGANFKINNSAADGDAVIAFQLSSTTKFSMGVEDGDSDKFVIERGAGALGAAPVIEIDSSGNVTVVDGSVDFDIAAHDGTNGLKLGGTVVTKTAAQINNMVSTSATNTFTADQTLNDSVNLTFGTGGDADIDYDGTNLVINPKVVGSGVLSLLGGLNVGVDGTGQDVTLFGGAANEKVLWDASECTLAIHDAAGTAIVTMGGDANGEYAVDIQNQSDASGRVRANAFITHSDGRLKKDIQPLSNPMDKLNKLQGVTYNWKGTKGKSKGWKSQEVGFIAQDVHEVLPQITQTDKSGMAHGIDYAKLTAVLTEAVKQQDTEIKNLRTTLSTVLKSQELLLEKLGIKK